MAGETQRDFDNEVLAKMAEGQSLRSICADLKDFGCPSASRFVQRVLVEPDFAKRYAQARELQCEAWGDKIIEEAINHRPGEKVKTLPDGTTEVTEGDCVDRSRLAVDALKWTLAKLHPKKYGDKLQHANSDGDGPVEIVVHRGTKPNGTG